MKEDYQKKLDDILDKIVDNKKTPRLLLHACCAPCSSYVLEYLSKYMEITLYYYNPNIEPVEEFNKRVIELKRLIKEMPLEHAVDIVVENYDITEFREAIKGYEGLKEGSERCFKCYRLRMEKAALYAKVNKYDYFTTTLSISPYKNCSKLNEIGEELQKIHKIKYLYADFKKHNGYKRSIELSSKYNLYRQDYCGCVFSKKEAMDRRKSKEIKNGVEAIMSVNKKRQKEDFKVKRSDYNNKFSLIKLLMAMTILIFGIYTIKKNDNITGYRESANLKEVKTNIGNNNIETDNSTNIDEYYFYGNHFNINGNINTNGFSVNKVNLILDGTKYKYSFPLNYTINSTGIHYFASKLLNMGLDLDVLNIDNYKSYIEVISNDNSVLYKINDKTNNKSTIYYTITDKDLNKKIMINNEDEYLNLNVKDTKEKIYDIIIDPGHGGKDEGACKNRVCEINYTLDLAKILKSNLEKFGYKVALTRNEDIYLEQYGSDGRIARAYKSKAKLLLSIHLNSTTVSYSGLELYTSNNLNVDFARDMVKSIAKVSDLKESNNTSFRLEPGIYSRTFSSSNVADVNKDLKEPYKNVSTNTNYYYMIRETGGYMAGAYVDGQNGKGSNDYRNSNVGLESYIIELGYINNSRDIESVNKNKNKYMEALANAINKHFKG